MLPGVIIGGPTASGKTAVAIAVAEACGGEIIGADAFQCYRGLPILTAQPSIEEQQRVPHHLIGSVELGEAMDVVCYLEHAREIIREVWSRGRVPILVGGTGLYIRSVLFGLAPGLPSPNLALRAELEARPLELIREQLCSLDPVAAQQVDLQNPRRVIRALEVCIQTGRPFSSFRHDTSWAGKPSGIWISWPREELRRRISERSNQMFQEGVVEEVRAALPQLGVTAAQAIGVDSIRKVLEEGGSEQAAREEIYLATRQYAKRQETWFRKEAALVATSFEQAVEQACGILKTNTV